MIKMKWNTFAGGTSSKDGTNSYSARGWFGLFTIDPPSAMRPRSGYAVRWANETGLPVKHTSGLWSDVGSFVSPAAAKTAASAYVEKHLKRDALSRVEARHEVPVLRREDGQARHGEGRHSSGLLESAVARSGIVRLMRFVVAILGYGV